MSDPPAGGVRPLAVVSLAVLAALVLALAFPLVDPDEGRNAEIAREMSASGDFVIPHLAGMPYLDKPPALFWAAAIAIRLLGPIPLAARLPAILAAAGTLLVLIGLARRQEDDELALRAAALLAVSPLFFGLSAYVIFDMPLTLCVTVVWTLLARELSEGASGLRRLAMFAALALGILLKGPVMLAWALGGSLGASLLARNRAPLRWLGWPPGWGLVLLTAGGWFALASLRHPEYPHYAFLEESLERLTSGSFRREQPAWFVPAVLVLGALPWSLTTPWASLRGAGTTGTRLSTMRIALGFVAFAAVFFTLSRSKLVTYLLPALPPLAWLAALAWGPSLASGARSRRVAYSATLVAMPLLLLVAGPVLHGVAERESGAALARAVRPALGQSALRYERCYSPGTDYLLGRVSVLVADSGHEKWSTYQVRYRDRLIAGGLWTPRAAPPGIEDAPVVVRRPSDGADTPEGWIEIYRDRRRVAYRTGVDRP